MRSCLGVFGGAEGALGAEGSVSISSSLSSESFASLYVVCVYMCERIYYSVLSVSQFHLAILTHWWSTTRGGRTCSRDSDNWLTFQGQEVWMQAKQMAMLTKSQWAQWRARFSTELKKCLAAKMASFDSPCMELATYKPSLWGESY